MYYACLAQELADQPQGYGGDHQKDGSSSKTTSIRLLSYAPGPLETDMVQEIRSSGARLHSSLRPQFAKQPLLDPLESARVLVQLIQDDAFVNGAHVDYYDVVVASSSIVRPASSSTPANP